MVSGGFRMGAWDYLRWKHVTPLKREEGEIIGAKMVIYAGESEEYYCFITPEAYLSLREWMDFRQSSGEEITEESWLMRDLWQTTKVNIKSNSYNYEHRKKPDYIYRLRNRYTLYYEWIERILQTPFEDYRKIISNLILAPYLIKIKKLSFQQCYHIIKEWLDKYNSLEKLDNSRSFNSRISYPLKNAKNKQIGPMNQHKTRTDSSYSSLYNLLKKKGIFK